MRQCSLDVEEKVIARLLSAMAMSVNTMIKKGATSIAVDVTQNGGGSFFANAAARLLSPPLIKCQKMELVRDPRFIPGLEKKLKILRNDLKKTKLAKPVVSLLKNAESVLMEEINAHKQPCDLSKIWANAPTDCSNRVSSGRTTCGLISYAPKDLRLKTPSIDQTFENLSMNVKESAYIGPLIVIADRFSSSASELFVAMLKDNKRATIIGETTTGTGCGYYSRPEPIILPHSKVKIKTPNCSRIRTNGLNEMFGIKPHISIDWDIETNMSKGKKLIRALSKAADFKQTN